MGQKGNDHYIKAMHEFMLADRPKETQTIDYLQNFGRIQGFLTSSIHMYILSLLDSKRYQSFNLNQQNSIQQFGVTGKLFL